MSKSLNEIPFDKIYPGMKLVYGDIQKCKVVLTKDNNDKQILVEWDNNKIGIINHSSPNAALLKFAE